MMIPINVSRNADVERLSWNVQEIFLGGGPSGRKQIFQSIIISWEISTSGQGVVMRESEGAFPNEGA